MIKTFCIVASKKDIAGMNIRDKLLSFEKWIETERRFDGNTIYYNQRLNSYLITINNDIIYSDYLKEIQDMFDFFIFVSRHYSESGRPSLHVHFTGNWNDENPYGGSPKSLSIAEPILARNAFLKLYENANQLNEMRFDISLEVTHHGPTDLDKPLFFIELGSREEQWVLDKPAEIIAETVIETIKIGRKEKYPTAIGIGGPHYAPSFTRYLLNNDIYLSHMLPKYHANNLDEEIANMMIERSSSKPRIVLLDWKGLKGPQRKKAKELFESLNLEIIKI